MGAAASVRQLYREAMQWFKTYIDNETYIADFAAIDKDGDNTLSYMEVRKWVEARAKKDPNWGVFITEGAPVLAIAHKMAAVRGDKSSNVAAPKVVDVNDFKGLLIQMFAIAILWSHFSNADNWEQVPGGETGTRELNFDAFRLAVRTLTTTHAHEELTDEELQADFDVIDTNKSGSIGFHEVCNFCCKFIDDPQTVAQKIHAAEERRRSVSIGSLNVPKFFGEVKDGVKGDIVKEINGKKEKGYPKAYAEGLTVEDKNKEALAILTGKLQRQASTARRIASSEKAFLTKKKFSTIESLIENNLCCGYLLKFCQREFTAENLMFILGVDEYRDFYAVDGTTVWTNSWKDTDATVKIDEPVVEGADEVADSGYWPSATEKEHAHTAAANLYAKFLSNDSPVQVCISESFMNKTQRRMKLLHMYGPHVFEEACLDPIKTMKKDVIPRFLVSDICDELMNQLALCDPLPITTLLDVSAPEDDTALKNVELNAGAGAEDSLKVAKAASNGDILKTPTEPKEELQLEHMVRFHVFWLLVAHVVAHVHTYGPISAVTLLAAGFVGPCSFLSGPDHTLLPFQLPSPRLFALSSLLAFLRAYFPSSLSHSLPLSFRPLTQSPHQVQSKSFYTAFEKYLTEKRCMENLYCLRLISRIEASLQAALLEPTNASQMNELAVEDTWDLYRFFVAAGAGYEISMSYVDRKHFMLEVARPLADSPVMLKVKNSAVSALFPHFEVGAGFLGVVVEDGRYCDN